MILGGPDSFSVEYFSNFLRDPMRSRKFCAGPNLFAQTAKYYLSYLCNHSAFAQKAPPRMSAQQCMRRKYNPWKWHRRVIREDIRGPHDTPWLWLRRPTSEGIIMRTYVLHRKNDLIYAHNLNIYESKLLRDHDLVIIHQMNSEKYHLALSYLNHFLPRAAKLDSLIDMCQRLTLASRSMDFPRESARARSNMQNYAAQWG